MNPETSATDTYKCASKPPPDARRAGQLMRLSKEWQAKAWAATQSDLGPESEMYLKTRRHWQRVRGHRFADDPSIAKVMAGAEEIAWNSMWRGYDFSVEALKARFSSQNIHITAYLWRDWIQQRTRNIAGVNFLVTHIPRIGPSGQKIIRTEQEVANATYLIGQFTHKLMKDGTFLPNAEEFENLYPPGKDPYVLCDIVGAVRLSGQKFKTSCLDSVTIPPSLPPVLTECSLAGGISQSKPQRGYLPDLLIPEGNIDDLRVSGPAEFLAPWKRDENFFPAGFTTTGRLTVSSSGSGRFHFDQQFSSVELNLSRSEGRSHLSGKIASLSLIMDSSTADLRIQKCDIGLLTFYGGSASEVLMTDSTIGSSWGFMDHLPRRLDIRDSQIGIVQNGVALSIENRTSKPNRCESLSISETKFEGWVSFDSQLFSTVNITRSTFSRCLSMRDTKVVKDFSMTLSTAASLDLACRQSSPDDQRTIGRLNLSGTTMEQTSQFDNRIFDGKAVFDGSTFGTPPQFYGATLSQDTSFRNVQILWQQKLRTHGTPRDIVLKDLRRRLARKSRRRAIVRSIIVRRQIFLGRWKGKTSFYERLVSVLNVNVTILLKTLKASFGLKFHEPAVLQAFDARNRYLAEVERAFRILRQKMDAIRAPALAESFGRDELRARHRRYGDKEVALWEYIFGKIYSFTTDYGASFGRPIAVLGAMTNGMAIIYMGLLRSFDYLGQAARVAMTVTMRPLLHLGPTYGRSNPDCSAKLDTEADAFDTIAFLTNCNEVTFKAVSFVHSIAVILLLFFAIGALRRRFRIG